MIKINYIPFSHNNVDYYLCTLPGKALADIAYVASRGISTEEGAVQRILNKNRISGIKDFILTGGFFPNNVILNFVDSDAISIDKSNQTLTLKTKTKAAQIIDGQHRIEGLKEAIKSNETIEKLLVPTVIAVGLSTAKCAKIFVSINAEQKTVPKSLIYDLYGIIDMTNRDFSVDRSTDIAKNLNATENSPFQGFIKFPGSRKFKGGIQLSTFVSNLKPLVKIDGEFQKYNIKTLDLQVRILKNYFSAIKSYYGKHWDTTKNPFIFASGFGAAIDVFIGKVLPFGYSKRNFKEDFFKKRIIIPKNELIFLDKVKGLGGTAAREKLKNLLYNFIKIDSVEEDEFEI